jgi:formate-dependent nitrite reductase cytochrome c552 subunit
MSLSRKYLMILVACLGLLALTACTREVTTIVQDDPQPMSCFECHSDGDLRVIQAEAQWAESVHSEGNTVAEGTEAGCMSCHSNEGFLQFVAGVPTYTPAPAPTVIGCFTCHAPHTNGDFGLRVTAPTPLMNGDSFDLGEGNTCVACHHARASVRSSVVTVVNSIVTDPDSVTITNRFGPHYGPQGDMLLGSNGYEYNGYDYSVGNPHRTITTDGCVDCHMKTVGLGVGGHTFAVSALDESGDPVYNTEACLGCHPNIGDTFDYRQVQADAEVLITQLHDRLVTAGFLNATTDRPIPGRISSNDAGAIWNYRFVKHGDRSRGVHNPDYTRDLLQSSIEYMDSRPTI